MKTLDSDFAIAEFRVNIDDFILYGATRDDKDLFQSMHSLVDTTSSASNLNDIMENDGWIPRSIGISRGELHMTYYLKRDSNIWVDFQCEMPDYFQAIPF